jgi:dUTP pyrophosphatase
MRLRGFEIISKKQFDIDFEDFPEVVYEELQKPIRKTKKSAGHDFIAPFNIFLAPGQDIVIPTGVKFYCQDDEELDIIPRSGLGFKFYCRLANTVGLIDSDYYNSEAQEGHIMIKIRNEGNKTMTVEKGQGFAQGVIRNYLICDGDDFESEGLIRTDGFGHTDRVR